MNRRIALILMLFLFLVQGFGQFLPNTIGVCYLEKEDSNSYFLTVAIPFEFLKKEHQPLDTGSEFEKVRGSVIHEGVIVFFDNEGELCRRNKKDTFLLEFWCDNDGGTQYRPTLRISLKKSDIRRSLTGIKSIQNICCFVLVNKSQQVIKSPDFKISSDIRLKGDYNGDKKADCFIWTEKDEAENCDGEPKNNLTVMLQVGQAYHRLRCCGP